MRFCYLMYSTVRATTSQFWYRAATTKYLEFDKARAIQTQYSPERSGLCMLRRQVADDR